MKIRKGDFFKVNNVSVDVDINIFSDKLNILTGNNGVGKTTFINKLHSSFDNIFICFQHRLISVNSARVKDILKILNTNQWIDGLTLKKNIKLFDFESILNREINELSGGENQLLKIIITLSSKKELLIFDEPSQYLDSENLKLFKSALDRCQKKILIIEHNLVYLDLSSISKLNMSYNSITSKLEVLNV